MGIDHYQANTLPEQRMDLPTLFHLADAFDGSMRRSRLWAVAPGVFAMAGVFLFHFGFLAAATIYVLSLIGGSLNAMRPALPEQTAPATLATTPCLPTQDSSNQPPETVSP